LVSEMYKARRRVVLRDFRFEIIIAALMQFKIFDFCINLINEWFFLGI